VEDDGSFATGGGENGAAAAAALPARPFVLLRPPRQVDLLRDLPVRSVVGRPDGGAEILRGCEAVSIDVDGNLRGAKLLGSCDEVLDGTLSDRKLHVLLRARDWALLASGDRAPVRIARIAAARGDVAARIVPVPGGAAAVVRTDAGVLVRRSSGVETTVAGSAGLRLLDAAAWEDEVVVLVSERSGARGDVTLHRIAPDGAIRPEPIGSLEGDGRDVGFVAATRDGYVVYAAASRPDETRCEDPAASAFRAARVPLREGGAVEIPWTPPDATSLPAAAGVLDDGVLLHWKPCGRGPLRLQVLAADGRTSPISEIRDTLGSSFVVAPGGDRVTVAWEVSGLLRHTHAGRRGTTPPTAWVGPRIADRTTTIPAGSALAHAATADLDGDGVPEGTAILMRDADAPAIARLARDGTDAWRAEVIRSLGDAYPAARGQDRLELVSVEVDEVTSGAGRAQVVRALFAGRRTTVEWIAVIGASPTTPVALDFVAPPLLPETSDEYVPPTVRILSSGGSDLALDVGGRRLPLTCGPSGCSARTRLDLDRTIDALLSGVARAQRPRALGLVSAARALLLRFGPGVELRADPVEQRIREATARLPGPRG